MTVALTGVAALPTVGQLVVFALGGALALSGQITIGTFLAFTTYIAALIAPARMVAGLVVTGQLARAGVERVYELIDSQPDIVDPPRAATLPAGPVGLELDDVRFGYARSEPVLDGVSLAVRPGETLAVIGTAGSGKSTVLALIAGLWLLNDGTIGGGD